MSRKRKTLVSAMNRRSKPELDRIELVSAACGYFCSGYTASQIKELMRRDHGVEISREKPYELIAYAASQEWLEFTPPHEYRLQQMIRDQNPRLQDARVVCTATMEDVAAAGARVLLRLLQEDEKREIHVGFAGGYTMRALARRLARLLRRPAENLGRKKVIFHAIVAGFDLYEPTTDPNAFFSFFVNDPAMQVETAFVGLHAPALVTPKQYRTLREMHGINEAFDHARKIDILVTSAGCAADPHSLLKHYAAVSQESYDEMMRKECIGDMFWRPLGPSGPIESDAAVRAMTIMELSDLSGFIQQKKRVLLVAGPCGECAAPKTDVVKAILDAEERLITHLVVDSRCARGLVGT